MKTKKNKNKKTNGAKNKPVKEEVKKKAEKVEEAETEKETSTLSDGVLDAFEEVAPIDPLLAVEDDTILPEDEEEEDELDSGDYRPSDEW